MWFIPLLIAGAKLAATAAISTAASYGVAKLASGSSAQTQSSTINLGAATGGSKGASTAKRQSSILNAAAGNQQHALNYYNEQFLTGKSLFITQGYLDQNNADDVNAMTDITNKIIDDISANPDYGIGASYTSSITGESFNTAPMASGAHYIDEYISQKLQNAANQMNTENMGSSLAAATPSEQTLMSAQTEPQSGFDFTWLMIGGAVILGIILLKRR